MKRLGGFGRMAMQWLGVAFFALSLGGCASVFSAQVTRYQQWPDHTVGATYWIEPEAAQRNNLQYQTFADTVRAALGPTGLVEARSLSQARFIVHMDYGSSQEREWRERMVDPYFYPGFPGPGFHHPWGWGYGPVTETVPVVVTRLHLSVRIDDQTQQGREVYRASAVTAGPEDQLGAAMPYLARALFDRFPGRNGQVVQVRYPRQ
ncbi:DUF4136 domain-containing protein [Castellaniella sp. MT123]|uniref:DUF4136 domain-containing protein n=1 Tax=Castellaniella sp. MT123 TaxID=3140381 RepID=UPI0031F44BFF